MKILIVDDSAVMRKMVMRTLRQAGYGGNECVEAGDGKQALEKIAECSPDLVLCDWNMPEMNGIDVLRTLKEQGSELPFCFITSESTQEMRGQAEEAGAVGFLTKPFTPDDFEKTLGDLLE